MLATDRDRQLKRQQRGKTSFRIMPSIKNSGGNHPSIRQRLLGLPPQHHHDLDLIQMWLAPNREFYPLKVDIFQSKRRKNESYCSNCMEVGLSVLISIMKHVKRHSLTRHRQS